jgi:hypothetical protein
VGDHGTDRTNLVGDSGFLSVDVGSGDVRAGDDLSGERRQGIDPIAQTGRHRQRTTEALSAKRERQCKHIEASAKDQGASNDRGEEIAARTVNKERARAGEAKEPSRASTEDISSGRRGGLRSHHGPGGRTRDQLYEEARRRGIKGRSTMSKVQLERAVDSKRSG